MNLSNLSTRLGCLLIAALLPASALAIDPPARETSRFALKTNYLQQSDEGIYELAFDNAHQYVFAAVTDRVNREANRGYLYAFNPTSLKIEHRYEMPYRAFSLAMNQPQHRLYIGHTQSASLRISLLDTATGKLTKTSDRLSFKTPNAADSRFEHLRHMVYSQDADTLFVSYSNMLKTAQGTQPLHRLLMLDGTTLALKGEIKEAYKGTAYGLTLDEETQKIYVGGRDYINEIDAKKQQVLRTIALKNTQPRLPSAQNLAVDADSARVFVVAFDHDDRSGPRDGLYIFDLRDGRQLGYVRTGAGANAVRYNPKYNELYVTNFTSGTLSVVDATTYAVTREFRTPVYPNQMVLSADGDTLYVGIKEGFNRDWDPDVFVEGAKERILRIDLRKS
ncbi:YncE family protein [Raoultella terrigena]|uniref:YncE family protein n=1 Tax=Raoultella terrigena TaxID=577 RepID=UPI00384FDA74